MSLTARELAEQLAEQTLDFFGSVRPAEGDKEELADHLIREAISWINDKYDLGLK